MKSRASSGLRFARLAVMAACSWGMLAAGAAHADHDMSGRWLVGVSQNGGMSNFLYNRWEVVQTGSDLVVTIETQPTGTTTYDGTIDTGTGDFVLDVPSQFPMCGTNTLVGNVSADGRTLTGTHDVHVVTGTCHPTLGCNVTCSHAALLLDGSRCGNEELDAWEDCDDGHVLDGDCCSSSCELDTAGTACTSDSDVCTDDVCDGDGSCLHPLNTAPCADPDGCGTGNCSAGECQITSPEPAGTACDGPNAVCTLDVCDGAGHCQAVQAPEGTDCDSDPYPCTSATCDSAGECVLDNVTACAPCGYCAGSEGCVRHDAETCDGDIDGLSISVELGDPDRHRLRIKLKDDVTADDMGDPLVSTQYTLCLYETVDFAPDRVLASSQIPAAGLCDGEPCWTQKSTGFRYKDKLASSGGIESMKLGARGFSIKGKGAGLGLPNQLTPGYLSVYPKIVADDGVSPKCWVHDVWAQRRYNQLFKGRY